MNMKLDQIMNDYTTGKKTVDDTNTALEQIGSDLRLNPEKNVLTPGELELTVVGAYPQQASGWGLMDTGTGSMDKVRVEHGVLEHPVGQMHALVYICGRCYGVNNDHLVDLAD